MEAAWGAVQGLRPWATLLRGGPGRRQAFTLLFPLLPVLHPSALAAEARMGEGPAESGRQPGSADRQGCRGKGAGTHAGGWVRPVRVPGHAHVCARVCARVCSCQWQRPLFLPTYLQSQRRKTVSEAEGPFATVTLTSEGQSPQGPEHRRVPPLPPSPRSR